MKLKITNGSRGSRLFSNLSLYFLQVEHTIWRRPVVAAAQTAHARHDRHQLSTPPSHMIYWHRHQRPRPAEAPCTPPTRPAWPLPHTRLILPHPLFPATRYVEAYPISRWFSLHAFRPFPVVYIFLILCWRRILTASCCSLFVYSCFLSVGVLLLFFFAVLMRLHEELPCPPPARFIQQPRSYRCAPAAEGPSDLAGPGQGPPQRSGRPVRRHEKRFDDCLPPAGEDLEPGRPCHPAQLPCRTTAGVSPCWQRALPVVSQCAGRKRRPAFCISSGAQDPNSSVYSTTMINWSPGNQMIPLLTARHWGNRGPGSNSVCRNELSGDGFIVGQLMEP